MTQKNFLKNFKFGVDAERIAMIFLWLKGYKILRWRYRNCLGEIDIIAKKRNCLVFVEVKARKGAKKMGEILNRNQINRIKNSAEYFVGQNLEFAQCFRSFDLIFVRGFFRLTHHKNFFS